MNKLCWCGWTKGNEWTKYQQGPCCCWICQEGGISDDCHQDSSILSCINTKQINVKEGNVWRFLRFVKASDGSDVMPLPFRLQNRNKVMKLWYDEVEKGQTNMTDEGGYWRDQKVKRKNDCIPDVRMNITQMKKRKEKEMNGDLWERKRGMCQWSWDCWSPC